MAHPQPSGITDEAQPSEDSQDQPEPSHARPEWVTAIEKGQKLNGDER